ncbi:unnamed protein product [Linum trigynum]|uniref:Uncharacterized protein n=1 Tax=Linum trigynum TaxID=586398 RepID=A0AAV2FBY2_9ROSI
MSANVRGGDLEGVEFRDATPGISSATNPGGYHAIPGSHGTTAPVGHGATTCTNSTTSDDHDGNDAPNDRQLHRGEGDPDFVSKAAFNRGHFDGGEAQGRGGGQGSNNREPCREDNRSWGSGTRYKQR